MNIKTRITHKDNIFLAISYCLAAHFLFAIMGAIAKYLAQTHHVVEIVFYRNLFIFIPLLIFMLMKRNRHFFQTKKPKLVALRAIFGGISLMLTFAALAQLPLAYATVIFFISSFITPALAFIFLKEHVSIHRWSAVIVGMCGVLIVAQPSGAVSITGLICAIIAACLHGSMFTLLRSLKSESSLTITFYFIMVGFLMPAIALPWVSMGIANHEIWLFMLLALSGGIAQFCLVNAYKYAQASLVTPFGYSALIWTILIDIYLWKYDLDFTAIICGVSLTIAAQLYILYREYIKKQITES